MIDWSHYANFSESEFRCHGKDCCGGRADMDPDFMAHLQGVRDAFGRPMPITSGYRCPEHNTRISKTGRTGPHTSGRAADIKVSGEATVFLLEAALANGMLGFGPMQHGPHAGRYFHLDDLRRRFWTYK